MAKTKEIDWNEGIIDLMPEEKQIRVLKKLNEEIQKMKQTLEGRKQLARAFGRKPSDFKV